LLPVTACGDDSGSGADPSGEPTTDPGTTSAPAEDPTDSTDDPSSTAPATTSGAPTTSGPGTTTDEETTTGTTEGSSEETAATAPEAPSNLGASQLEGGGHLVWNDNSDNEDEFVIMRSTDGGDFVEVWRVTFDTETFHDTPEPGSHTWYVYAVNAVGMSEPSNEASLVLP
jgi:hypothetical protein